MVGYVKNKSLLVLRLTLLCFVVSSYARFSIKVTNGEINDICTHKGINKSFCSQFLKLSAEMTTLDHSGLTIYLINYNSRKTSDMLKQFQSLNSTSSENSRGPYEMCSDILDLAIGHYNSALRYLATKNYEKIKMASGCGWELQLWPSLIHSS
ncbi:hypothetical protein CARUB_v10012012mg [Capsella rubella]|uniref:Pectinesterase inhibitor domain-containing protein n=1 Tax=Capsella rubella TaxID=81985 RepID=R0IIG4_9BRAS|nr:hypothetical protein CARUB_v10012012mg [Capsella rubella]